MSNKLTAKSYLFQNGIKANGSKLLTNKQLCDLLEGFANTEAKEPFKSTPKKTLGADTPEMVKLRVENTKLKSKIKKLELNFMAFKRAIARAMKIPV